jgi:hypothetical protein
LGALKGRKERFLKSLNVKQLNNCLELLHSLRGFEPALIGILLFSWISEIRRNRGEKDKGNGLNPDISYLSPATP